MRARETATALAKNTLVAGQFITGQVLEDPINLALNLVRKMPHSLGQKVAKTLTLLPGAGSQALGAQLQGARELPPAARRLLEAGHQPGLHPWKSLQGRIAAEVAISYGAVDYRNPRLPASVRARTAWDRGDLSAALEISRQAPRLKALARKLEGEAQALEPGWLPAPYTPQPQLPGQNPASGQVLHLLTNSLPYTQSGYTLRSHRLLSALAEAGSKLILYTRTGYPVLIGGLDAGPSSRVDQLTYRRILPLRLGKTLPLRLEQAVSTLYRAVASSGGVQVIHTTTNYHNGLVAAALARATGRPWIYEVRGIMEETWVSRQKGSEAQAAAEKSERFAKIRAKETELMQGADHLFTLSQTMKDLLVARGVAAEKITLLPNAVREELFQENLSPDSARQQLGLSREGIWVGTVSSLVAYEGLDTLLEATALLRNQGHDLRVLLAGDGTARPALEQLAQDLGIAPYVHFTGRLPQAQAPLAHQSLDIFCVPRTNDRVCRSVTPLKPIEAMALARPVVMSDIPPLAELVNNGLTGPTGLLAPPEDAAALAAVLACLVESEDLRASLAANGRDFARTRTWKRNAEIMQEVYRKLAQA